MDVVYKLRDPRGHDQVRYVGVTNDMVARFLRHLRCDSQNKELNEWISELRQKNRLFIMEPIEERDERKEAEQREAYWIESFIQKGYPLLNKVKLGGHSPRQNVAQFRHPVPIEIYISPMEYERVYAYYAQRCYRLMRDCGGPYLQIGQEQYIPESQVFVLTLLVGLETILPVVFAALRSAIEWKVILSYYTSRPDYQKETVPFPGERVSASQTWRKDPFTFLRVPEGQKPPKWSEIKKYVCLT